jgi:four helix bundle protein
MRRCAVSITSNIAEGFSRQTFGEKIQFYGMAQGSVTELQNQLLVAKGVNILGDTKFSPIYAQSVEVHKVLNGLIRKSKDFRNS